MIVMKFGGTSVQDSEAVGRAAGIIEGQLKEQPVIVVSALGGTTDRLVAVLDALEKGRAGQAREVVRQVEAHHREVIDAILEADPDGRQQAHQALDKGLARLRRLVDGMDALGEVSLRSRDAVLGTGELLSAPLFARFLAARGLPATAVDPREVIVTDGSHGGALPLREATDARCQEVLELLLAQGRVVVVGGYVGRTAGGVMTTLGRGGSDLTASLIARALGAAALEYWKDVDGILTADPRLVTGARPLQRISFREAAELAFLGAKVLHPAAIQPAVEAGIPVRVRNSHRPDAPGTVICKRTGDRASQPENVISSVACKRNQVLVNVYSTRMLGASGFLSRVFEVFDRLGLSVDHIATSEVNVTVTLGPTDRLADLREALGEVARVDVVPGVGIVSVVGERLADTAGVAARIFRALEQVNVRLVTYTGDGVNLSLVVQDDAVGDAVQRLHAELCGEEVSDA